MSEVSSTNFEEFKTADKIVALAFLSSSTDAPAAEFSTTADKHREDYLFGLTTDEKVIEAAGVKPPAIVLYRSFDEPSTEFPYPVPSATAKEIEDWIKDLSIPVFEEVGADNYQVYAQSGKPLAYLFVDPSDPKHKDQIESIKPIAAKYKGQVNFVWIDAVKYGDHAKALALSEPKWPSFVVQELAHQLKYPYDQSLEFKAEAIDELAQQFVEGKLQPTLKSQPTPEAQDESVFNLVGKQFDSVVFDDEKDVFVEFYASWYVLLCSHSYRYRF